jgi:hypothetical protein
MAICITANITDIEHGWVSRYFARCRSLAPLGIPVSENVQRVQDRSFIGLLAAIQAANDSKVVVVTHGFPDGSGLFLPLYPTAAGLPTSAPYTTDDMLYRLSGIAQDADAKAAAKRAELFSKEQNVPREHVDTLVAATKALNTQGKGKELIEFRGCSLGKNKISLQRFRRFLGAKALGAPDVYSDFGSFRQGSGASAMKTHVTGHSGLTETYDYDVTGKGKCLVCMSLNAQNKPAAGHVVAATEAALSGWYMNNMYVLASLPGGEVPVHFLWDESPAAPPGVPTSVKMRARPYFPQNPEYKAHIQYAY